MSANVGPTVELGLNGPLGTINPNYRFPDVFGSSNPVVLSNSASGSSWSAILPDIVKTAANTGFTILQQRYGGPQPGQYFQTPQGVAYNIPGSIPSVGVFPGQGFNINAGSLLLFGGLAVVALIALKGR